MHFILFIFFNYIIPAILLYIFYFWVILIKLFTFYKIFAKFKLFLFKKKRNLARFLLFFMLIINLK